VGYVGIISRIFSDANFNPAVLGITMRYLKNWLLTLRQSNLNLVKL
jgi:hypothetical protein